MQTGLVTNGESFAHTERKMTSVYSRIRLISSLLFLLFLPLIVLGQTSSSLSGAVQDPQGNAVAGAKVTLSDASKGLQLETTSSADGTFSFPTLQPGTYSVSVEAQGFKKMLKTGIVVAVADRASTGLIALEIGAIGEVVEVTADAAQMLIKTESGETSQVDQR